MNYKKILRELVPYVVVVVVVLLIKAFIVTPVKVSGVSMYSNLHNADIMILNRISYKFSKIERGDIVVVDVNSNRLIKRVIALPGDKIYAFENVLYINDEPYEEDYLADNIVTDDFDLKSISNQEKLAKDHYFLMGDNRQQSADSRVFGTVSKKQIIGKSNLIIFPLNRIGIKK